MGCPGCYTLDCYCDNQKDKRHDWMEFPHQYTDEYGSKCRSQARKDGWKFDDRNNIFLCPKCNPSSRKFIDPKDVIGQTPMGKVIVRPKEIKS